MLLFNSLVLNFSSLVVYVHSLFLLFHSSFSSCPSPKSRSVASSSQFSYVDSSGEPVGGPAGLPASPERPGPPEPHLPLPPLSGLGRPERQEQLQQGAAPQGRQRRGPELRDQPLYQSLGRWLLCEFELENSFNIFNIDPILHFHKNT